MNKALILVLIAECWITIGQVCFKKGANRLTIEKGDRCIFNNEKKMHLSPFLPFSILGFPTIWIGAASMLVGLLFWFTALSAGDLSYVYLLGSIQYIFALIASHFFLNEKIDSPKLIGTLLITLGIILTAFS